MKHIFQLSVFFNNTCYTFTDILSNFSKNLIKVTNKQKFKLNINIYLDYKCICIKIQKSINYNNY